MSNVAILGASDSPARYSNRAQNLLQRHGHKTYPVNPRLEEIDHTKVYPDLTQMPCPIDTLTVYLRPEKTSVLLADILQLRPARVIFNPNTEDSELESRLKEEGISVLRANTLDLLDTGKF